MTFPANTCLHCFCELSDGQTMCLACGSRCATVATFYAAVNAGLREQGIDAIDAELEAKQRAMWAQLDVQRAEMNQCQRAHAFCLTANDHVRTKKSSMRWQREH